MPVGTLIRRNAASSESLSENVKRTVADELAGTAYGDPFIPEERLTIATDAPVGTSIEPMPLFASFTAASKQDVIVAFVFYAPIFMVCVPAVSVASSFPNSVLDAISNGYSDQSVVSVLWSYGAP